MTTLTLNTNGPSPDPLTIGKGAALTITNAMSSSTTVTGDPGLFNPAPGEIAAGGSWSGRVGNTDGTNTYTYTTDSPKRNVRSGTIDING